MTGPDITELKFTLAEMRAALALLETSAGMNDYRAKFIQGAREQLARGEAAMGRIEREYQRA